MPKVDFKKIKALQHFKHEMPEGLKKIVGNGLPQPKEKPHQLHPELQKLMPQAPPPLAGDSGEIPHHGTTTVQPQNNAPGTVNPPNPGAGPADVGQKKKTTLTVIRHGSTEMNEKNVNRGRIEVPLSAKGKQQAKELGKSLKNNKPDFLVSSSLGRAQETARTISSMLRIPIKEVSEAFHPWGIGDFSGKDIMESLPTLQSHIKNTPDKPLPNGESFNTFKNRALSALDKLIKENPGKHIGILTHHRVQVLIESWLKSKTGTADHEIDNGPMMTPGIPAGSSKTYSV